MSVSPLKSIVAPAVLLAGTVFCSLTLPLATFGAQPVEIQMNQEPLFDGKLKDVAAPYVGLAALLSLGTGVASIALSGWRLSSHNSEKIKEELSNLQKQLQDKDARLEAVLLSTPKLEESGLSFFLQDEVKPVQAETVAHTAAPAAAATTATASYQRAAAGQPTVHATAPLPAAQAFMGFNRAQAPVGQAVAQQQPSTGVSPTGDRIQVLHDQLKQLMVQLESLQGSLPEQPQSAHQADKPKQIVTSLENSNNRYQTIDSHWGMQPVAS